MNKANTALPCLVAAAIVREACEQPCEGNGHDRLVTVSMNRLLARLFIVKFGIS